MKIPLANQLRGIQTQIARLQDEALDITYAILPEAILHGGTAIWRCYRGKRFSDDLDFYALAGKDFRERFSAEAGRRGLQATKFRRTENSIYARLSDGRSGVSVEISTRAKGNAVPAAYERADGTHTEIRSLLPEDLIIEKAHAFVNRKLIRDIYDVYFLSGAADLKKTGPNLRELMRKFLKPADEKNLRTLVYSGPAPSFAEMLAALERRLAE